MLGAIIGDYVGSIYEMNNCRRTDFPFFSPDCRFTDDSMMTVAVADALLTDGDFAAAMRRWGRQYPDAGYGGRFSAWIHDPAAPAYYSFGNGSAMRVSPVGWVCDTLEDTLALAEATAVPTHDHPDGVLGAQVVAGCIFLLRRGADKEEVRAWVESTGYLIPDDIDALRTTYRFDVSCKGSVPQAVAAFLAADDFESAIRLAVSIGGDSDTIASIAGALAEVVYPIPDWIRTPVLDALAAHGPADPARVLHAFYERLGKPLR